jgi:hypothetical protein
MAIAWNKSDLRTLSEKKLEAAAETCQSLIYQGIDVELSSGVEHFSLTTHDQTNIDSMLTAVTMGATEYPYHSDGHQCKVYSAADILTLYVAYKTYVTQQTTYCNFLKIWIGRETDNAVIGKIEYGVDLPEDLAAEMNSIMESAAAQINSIISSMKKQ